MIAFTDESQEVTINEEAPGNTGEFCVVIRTVGVFPITVTVTFGPAGDGNVASELM